VSVDVQRFLFPALSKWEHGRSSFSCNLGETNRKIPTLCNYPQPSALVYASNDCVLLSMTSKLVYYADVRHGDCSVITVPQQADDPRA
jgi:hypothetical protein